MLRPYQTELLDGVKSILKTSPIACIAAGTGSGKTEIAIQFMKDNPTKRFLILAHGQTELRTNFLTRLQQHGVAAHEVAGDLGKVAVLKATNKAKVVVSIPQSIYRHLDNLTNFDYVIVDEAHQFYESRPDRKNTMYPAIIAWHKGKTVLLTASHYGLRSVTKEQKVFFSREQGFEVDAIQDVRVCRRVVKHEAVRDEDFSKYGELKDAIHVNSYSAVKEFMKPEHFPLLIAVRTTEEADDLYRALPKRVKALVSHSTNDKESDKIDAFKAGEADVCVVVNRGQLGFDYPGLVTFLDATYTKNVTRIEQMVGRVARKAPSREKKFVKLVFSHMQDEYALICTAVLALGATKLYTTWDGEYRNLTISVPMENAGSRPSGGGQDRSGEERGPRIDRKRLATLEMTFGEYVDSFNLGNKEISLAKAVAQIKNTWIIDPENKKSALLELAKRGENRPIGGLGSNLLTYLNPKSTAYDAKFTEELRNIAPNWLLTTQELILREFIEAATNLEPRPNVNTKRGVKYFILLREDEQFRNTIEKVNPEWLRSPADLKRENTKKTLLLKAAEMREKPMGIDWRKFGYFFQEQSSGFCPEFKSQLELIRPEWFETKGDTIKETILKMARAGEARPRIRTNLRMHMDSALAPSSHNFDKGFREEIQRLRPDWFVTSAPKKHELVELAKTGSPRPPRTERLGKALVVYTQKKANAYDPEFDAQIRALRPDWFRK